MFVSLDVVSLFTNVPLRKTVNINLKHVYSKKLINTSLSKRSLKKLILDTYRGCKWNILWTYIRNAEIVMYGPYCVHIWHLYVPCGFAENFPAITWRVLAKSKQTVCITHLIITWRNKWVCKIGKSGDKVWFLICCI